MSVVQPPTTTRSRQCHDVDEDEVRSTVFAMPYTSIYGRQFAHALPHQHRPAREERPGAAGEIQVLHVADHPNERVISVAPAGTHALVAERRSGFALMVDGTRTPLVVDRGGASTYVRSWVTVPRHCNGEPSLCWSSWGKSTPFTALPRCVNMGDDCAVTDARPFFGTNQSRDDLDAHGHMGGIEAVIDAECRLCLRGWMAEGPDGDALARALAGPACARPLPIVRHNGYQVFTGLAVHHVAVSARACFAVLRASGKVVAWGSAVKELPEMLRGRAIASVSVCASTAVFVTKKSRTVILLDIDMWHAHALSDSRGQPDALRYGVRAAFAVPTGAIIHASTKHLFHIHARDDGSVVCTKMFIMAETAALDSANRRLLYTWVTFVRRPRTRMVEPSSSSSARKRSRSDRSPSRERPLDRHSRRDHDDRPTPGDSKRTRVKLEPVAECERPSTPPPPAFIDFFAA